LRGNSIPREKKWILLEILSRQKKKKRGRKQTSTTIVPKNTQFGSAINENVS